MTKTTIWMTSVAAFAGTLFLAGASASAQDLNAQTFTPASGPHGVFSLEYGRTLEHLKPTGGVMLNYSSRPLVATETDGDEVVILDQQLATHLYGGLGITEWLQVDLDAPVYLVNELGLEDESLSGANFGDMHLKVKSSFFNDPESDIGLGLMVDMSLPTGDGAAFIGTGSVGVTPKVLFDAKLGDFQVGVNVGANLQGSDTYLDYEDSNGLVFGVGAEYTLMEGLLMIGGEVFGRSDFSDLFAEQATPLEGLVGAKLITSSGIAVTGAAGGGFTGGVGSPEFRTILGISWAERELDFDHDGIENSDDRCPQDPEDLDGYEDTDGCPEADNDLDGVPDATDACPNTAEDMDEFEDEDGCPETDNDGDGILDDADTCPDDAEDIDGFEDDDGCPEFDNDADNIIDERDACPDDAEDEDGFQDEDGCPEADNDLDGLLDEADQCPNEAGLPADNGCPPAETKAVLEGKAIKILDKVFFETGNATIKDESFGLLDQVALVLRTNPSVTKVEIGGHTDDRGRDDANQKLSEERAQSVRAYLVSSGIAGERLTAVGYGETQPIEKGRSRAARAANRRVEFKILEQEGVEPEADATETPAAPEESTETP